MKHAAPIAVIALLLSGCSVLPGRSAQGPDRAAPAASANASAAAPRVAVPAALARRGGEAQCLAGLGQTGMRFEALPDRYLDQGCSNLNTVLVYALRADSGELGVSNMGPVTCPVSAAFAAWARFGVDRAARQIFGSPLASIQTMGSYSCRDVAGTGRRSAHASAAAIDIGGFVLEDGRRVSVEAGWNGNAQEREFLRTVQRSACRRFGTVLGPDYNAAHRDHLHVEGVIEGSSYCR